MADKAKEYYVKVPIYTTENIVNEKGLFGSTYDNMITAAKERVDKYNSDSTWHVTSDKRAKMSVTGINKIDYFDCNIGRDKCLLLQATAYRSKLIDGYFESEESEVIVFKENDKICSDTHFILLYPNIFNNNTYWRVFIYEDPSKTNDEVARVAKLIMKDIIGYPIRNIKEEKLLSDLREYNVIAGIEVSFISLNDTDDETPPYLAKYAVDTKIKTDKRIKLENIPTEDAIKVYENVGFENNYKKKQIRYLLNNRRVLTVTQEFYENMKQTFEDSFNYRFLVTQEQLNVIFDRDFIIERLSDLVCNFMSLNSDN